MYTVYILLCNDDSYHWGVTKDLNKRLAYHEDGSNSNAYTFQKRPLKLVFKRSFDNIQQALFFEKWLAEIPLNKIDAVIKNELAPDLPIIEELIDTEETVLTLPATYFGNIAYYEQIKNYTTVHLDGQELFAKQSYRSRATILSANGLQNLIVPVTRPSGKETLIMDILISYEEDWIKHHKKAIESAYRRAPYYEYYANELFAILDKKHTHLLALNQEITQFICEITGRNTSIKIATDRTTEDVALKILVSPKNRLAFIGKPYRQIIENSPVFEPNLSVLDLLFNEGKGGFK